ncbi:MAG: GGDEF domain-containing protein, partial [Campylobacter sp.]|nr:GGDEF domain-containing protein [Campylobacter sp.]
KNQIKEFNPWGTNEADFISIANNIIANFEKLSTINDQKNLTIDSKIFGIHSEFTDFINQYYSELKYATIFFFLLFLTSMCALLLMEIFSIRQSALYRAFKEIADKSFCSISILDKDFKFKYANEQFQDSTKYSQNELNDKKMEILSSYEFREGFYIRMYDSVKKLGIFEHNELISKGKNGNLLFEKIKFFKLPPKDTNYAYGVIKLDQSANKDIKEKLTDTEFELSNSAFLDHLTGFGNEAALMLRINQNELGKIIYININNFTNLSFFYKTNVINEILTQFAKTLKLAVETHRINAQIFRLQLDEFCLWYSGDDIKKDVKFIM